MDWNWCSCRTRFSDNQFNCNKGFNEVKIFQFPFSQVFQFIFINFLWSVLISFCSELFDFSSEEIVKFDCFRTVEFFSERCYFNFFWKIQLKKLNRILEIENEKFPKWKCLLSKLHRRKKECLQRLKRFLTCASLKRDLNSFQ